MKQHSGHKRAYEFYMSVYSYIHSEYKPKYARLYANSDIAERLADLVTQYYWGGNSVPFTAGQIVDLLKSKYNERKK